MTRSEFPTRSALSLPTVTVSRCDQSGSTAVSLEVARGFETAGRSAAATMSGQETMVSARRNLMFMEDILDLCETFSNVLARVCFMKHCHSPRCVQWPGSVKLF